MKINYLRGCLMLLPSVFSWAPGHDHIVLIIGQCKTFGGEHEELILSMCNYDMIMV